MVHPSLKMSVSHYSSFMGVMVYWTPYIITFSTRIYLAAMYQWSMNMNYCHLNALKQVLTKSIIGVHVELINKFYWAWTPGHIKQIFRHNYVLLLIYDVVNPFMLLPFSLHYFFILSTGTHILWYIRMQLLHFMFFQCEVYRNLS